MPLRLMIDNSSPEDVAPQAMHPSADFVQAAIRTAKHSRHKTRTKIIADVCEVLDCQKEELDFLFTRQTPHINFDLPGYRRESTFLEAAE